MKLKRLICHYVAQTSMCHYLLCLLLVLSAFSVQASGVDTDRAWVQDPSGQMTLADVKRAEQVPLDDMMFSQGYSQSVYWIRLRIDPRKLEDMSVRDLVVRLRPPYQDQIRLYDPLATDDSVRVTGDDYDWANDEYQSLNLNFVIPVGKDPRDVWLRLKASASTLTFIEVLTLAEVRAADRR